MLNEEQQDSQQMIREINEEDAVPLAAIQTVGDVLANEPLNSTN